MSDVIIYNNQPPVIVDVTNPVTQLRYCGIAGYYGQFYSTTNQTATLSTVAYPIEFTQIAASKGVTNDNGTKLEFPNAGVYNIQFSVQFINTTSGVIENQLWFRKNGTDIAFSNGHVSVTAKHGQIDGRTIVSWNIIERVNVGDYIELMWQSDNVGCSVYTFPAGTTPTSPVSPSVIITATQVAD